MSCQDLNDFQYSNGYWPIEESSRVIRIPAGIGTKKQLLAILALGLDFPGYFGWNWDAFEECLRDLSWIPAPAKIVLIHHDLPLAHDVCEAATYLSILRDAIGKPGTTQSPELIVVFPSQYRESVEAAVEN
ncbi:MAG: barstar family protein [Planctomycetota bacterium]